MTSQSFTAELKNITIYPKEDYYLCYGIVEQNFKFIKIMYKGSCPKIAQLLGHKGKTKFFPKVHYIDKPVTMTTYKQQDIPMFEITHFLTTSPKDNNQPTITSQTVPPKHEIVFDDQQTVSDLDFDE